MGASLGGLYGGRNLCVRGREQAGDLLGQRRIGRQPGKLALPQIEVTPGQAVEFARQRILVRTHVIGAHAAIIAHCPARLLRSCPGYLSHCGIGAKVA
ncbi:MAG: hypothetical protein J0H44_08040 [Alphaproteobacteria bacterium]|nr:hypothetical protein [Alphaproteobacteria bacterium]